MSQDDVLKCEKILDLLLKHKMNINRQCFQRYTPFLLAVRLSNADMVKSLLKTLIDRTGLMKVEDLDLRTGLGLNSACHIAAAKTNFQILYDLSRCGSNIFVRNKENKTCFQVVNNNLLMLKIVKKLERKYFVKNKL
jgi:ankyrin repeat protein